VKTLLDGGLGGGCLLSLFTGGTCKQLNSFTQTFLTRDS